MHCKVRILQPWAPNLTVPLHKGNELDARTDVYVLSCHLYGNIL